MATPEELQIHKEALATIFRKGAAAGLGVERLQALGARYLERYSLTREQLVAPTEAVESTLDILDAARGGPPVTDPEALLGIKHDTLPALDVGAGRTVGALTAGVVGAPVALATGPWAPLTELGIVALGSQMGAEAVNLWNEHIAGVPDERGTVERLVDAGTGIVTEGAYGAGGGLVGQAAPHVIKGTSQFLKHVVGGGTPETTAALKAFKNAGVEPTMGMVAGRKAQGFERAVEKMPLSSGIMQRKTDQVRQQLIEASERIQKLSGRTIDEMAVAGGGIREGLRTGIASAKKRFEDAYRFIPGLSRLKVNIDGPRELAEQIIVEETKGLGDEAALRIANRILTRKGGMDRGFEVDFDEAVKLRSDLLNLGRTKEAEVAGAAESAAERLAGALDEAMSGAATRGVRAKEITPHSFEEWRTVNRNYAQFREELKQIRTIAHSESGEAAFKLAIAGAGDGPSRLEAVKGLVPEEAWRDFMTYQLGRLGLERPGKGVGMQLYYSQETYLTNVLSVKSPRSRTILFGPKGSELRRAVDNLTEVAGKLRDARFMANPSGTAGQREFMHFVSGGGTVAGISLIATGNPLLGSMQLAAQFGSPPAIAKLMTWPWFVRWYAAAAEIPPENIKAMAGHMAALPRMVEQFPEYRDALLAYVDGVDLLLPPQVLKPFQRKNKQQPPSGMETPMAMP